MKCFDRMDTHSVFAAIIRDMKNEVSGLEAKELDGTNREEWIDYFLSKYEIEPVVLYPDSCELDFHEKDVQRYNSWSQFGLNEPQYITCDGIQAVCKVPFTGDDYLFQIHGMTCSPYFEHEPERIIKPNSEGIGYLVLTIEMTQGEASADGIKKTFEEIVNDFQKELAYVNKDVAQYNSSLQEHIEKALDKRIAQLEKLVSMRKELNLPLNRVKDAPMAIPVPLKKKRPAIRKPQKKDDGSYSYSIADADFGHINEIIENCGSMMEVTPQSFSLLGEEQLRDHMLSVLGTHYENVTGETFRKHGKTDINISLEDHVAYIAECKIWSGVKNLEKAIGQLFSYTTWRDTKVSIIVFNKTVQNYSVVLDGIGRTLEEIATEVHKHSSAQWECVIPHEDGRRMKIVLMVFDLYAG